MGVVQSRQQRALVFFILVIYHLGFLGSTSLPILSTPKLGSPISSTYHIYFPALTLFEFEITKLRRENPKLKLKS